MVQDVSSNLPRRELVSPAARRAFREIAPAIVVREIHGKWQDQGFGRAAPSPDEDGERRALYQGYLDAVDWCDPGQVARAIRVFESTAKAVEPELRRAAYDLIEENGYRVDDEGRITGDPVSCLREGALGSLSDPSAIREHLDRITRAIGSGDPAQAIGSAKELIESTAKVVLREVGRPSDDSWDVPKLVPEAQLALQVHPSTAQTGPDGGDAVKRILGAATTITAGVAELRNRGFGTGHGSSGRRVGLGARHAHLAVGAARLWCEFMLDTLGDPDAPWRETESGMPAAPVGETSR
jgi:hypothetical protein